jgi:hypothetical protein
MVSNSGTHVQAIVRLDPVQAEPILRDLLREPECELDAAWALRTIAKKQPGGSLIESRFGWPARDYRKIQSGPPEWTTIFEEERRIEYVGVIRQRIVDLREESKSGDHKIIPYHYRLKELAKVLAAMDPKHSADLISEIAALPADYDGWSRVALLESLVFGDVRLPADRLMTIIEPVIEQFRKHGINNDSSLLTHLLCILPFVDSPAIGIAKVRALASEFRLSLYELHDLLMALSKSSDQQGLSLLRDLALQNEQSFQHNAKEWLEAIAACPLTEARDMLLSFVEPEVTGSVGNLILPDYAADFLAARLSELARTDASVAERILQLTSLPVSPQRRLLLAKVIAWLDSPQSLLAGLNLIDDSSAERIPYDLRKAIEEVFLEKRPYAGNSQSYTLVPRAASDLRKRLLEMAEHDPRRARSAYDLLGQIEEWRLEYGRPSSEPRHPAYESGEAWPPLPPETGDLLQP